MRHFLICLFTFDHYALYKGIIVKVNKSNLTFWEKVYTWWYILWHGESK